MTVTPLDCARAAIAAYNEPPTFTAAGVEVLRVEMRRAVIYSHRVSANRTPRSQHGSPITQVNDIPYDG